MSEFKDHIIGIDTREESMDNCLVTVLISIKPESMNQILGYRCKYPKCYYIELTLDDAYEHVKCYHKIDQPFQCNACKAVFADTDQLLMHKKSEHNNQNKCDKQETVRSECVSRNDPRNSKSNTTFTNTDQSLTHKNLEHQNKCHKQDSVSFVSSDDMLNTPINCHHSNEPKNIGIKRKDSAHSTSNSRDNNKVERTDCHNTSDSSDDILDLLLPNRKRKKRLENKHNSKLLVPDQRLMNKNLEHQNKCDKQDSVPFVSNGSNDIHNTPINSHHNNEPINIGIKRKHSVDSKSNSRDNKKVERTDCHNISDSSDDILDLLLPNRKRKKRLENERNSKLKVDPKVTAAEMDNTKKLEQTEEIAMKDNIYVTCVRLVKTLAVKGYRCTWPQCQFFMRKKSKVYKHVGDHTGLNDIERLCNYRLRTKRGHKDGIRTCRLCKHQFPSMSDFQNHSCILE